jgi:hypothetical protein
VKTCKKLLQQCQTCIHTGNTGNDWGTHTSQAGVCIIARIHFIVNISFRCSLFLNRIKDTHADGQLWTDSSKKLQKHLLENVRFLKPVEQAFQDVLSGLLTSQGKEKHATSLSLPNYFSTFACNLQEYVNYAQNTIEPLLLATLREESSKISCSSTQQAANSRVQSAVKSFNSILSQVTIQVILNFMNNNDIKNSVI